MKHMFFSLFTLIGTMILISSCSNDDEFIAVITDDEFEATDWTSETHSKDADPNFDEVFDNNAVKRLDFVISEENWQVMLGNMADLYGTFGSSSGGGSLLDTDEDPVFVPADVYYNDIQWYKVGVRFKGNSSLQTAWSQGILKLSFKLDFDEFEDEYPQIDNQRFYGFKKFSLKNNFDDASFLREKVVSDIYQNAGMAVSHTAFYTLYVDHGSGPEYFGLYTLVEEVDNTVIDEQFSSDDGNLYKPTGAGASFVNGTFNEDDFEKKTNEDDVDWSDIQALFTALHSSSRTSDAQSWRTGLETVFETDVFLRYLAINTVIQNWDSYGRMTQNYYLYNDPDNSLLTWIPWDHNEALQDGKQGGALSLDFSDLQSGSWPLIEYLYADEVYRAKYDAYVQETIEGPFEENAMQTVYDTYTYIIEPYATSEVSGYTFLQSTGEFQQTINELKQQVSNRTTVALSYLD
jgi:hypothetical protein